MPDEAGAFVKTGPPGALARFEAEADGLEALARCGAIRVPAVIDCGMSNGQAFIALERLSFESRTEAAAARLGEQLAALHRHTGEEYGWHRDNTIGLTPQRNPQGGDWPDFFRRHRLRFQLELARTNGHGGELEALGERVSSAIDGFFDGYRPEPSLLHGDLWAGNWGVVDGQPVIFDPAVHYGDRESDIAMTMLFGGFGPRFYAAYEAAWPLASGHRPRIVLYQLYHVLNHLNLFGGGYREQALSLMRSLV